MYTFSRLFAALMLALTIVSCSSTNKINSLKPEPDDASPLLYDNEYSFISLPVSIKLKDIENKANTALSGVIYDDANLEDDNVIIKVWKQAPIVITSENSKIKIVLPLKVYVKVRYGTQQLGLDLRDTKELNLNGVVTLVSDISLSNWKLNSSTTLQSLDWTESPSITILGKNVPITYLINPAVKIFKSKIEKKIDESIEKSMDFKPNVMDALQKISTPFQMNEAYQTWFRIVPAELYSTDSKVSKGTISMQMGMKCYMETIIGAKPESKFEKDKIVLKPVTKMPDQITASIAAVSTYTDATALIMKNFANKEFGSGTKKVTVQKVELWHKAGKMVIALDVTGTVNGTIYLTGIPTYNETTKEIYFDQLDYALDTKSSLLRTANWLMQGVILKKIEESCRYSIQSNMEEGKKSMVNYLNNYSPMPGVFVNGKINALDFQKIQLTNKAIIAFVKVNGTVSVTVDGLK